MNTATKQAQRTPGPWQRTGDKVFIPIPNERLLIADCNQSANAAFIVKACNAHDDLLEALRLLAGGYMPNASDDSSDMEILFWSQALARAALAKAES